ncbi:MAG: phosphoglucosamine mutase [Flavobacteriaceae bacterium]|nr:phosphoglucosamine mutase [Flavobacteriaceae bacterium]
MTLIKSISGIRGTIGGKPSSNLTPLDVVRFSAAYGEYIKSQAKIEKCTVVIGRDARISGEMVKALVTNTLVGLGIDVVDLNMATTPTVEMMVTKLKAQGGIILTASHNPKQWNALKLLDSNGEFLNAKAGEKILAIAEEEIFNFAFVDDLGSIKQDKTSLDIHIKAILKHPLVEVKKIKEAQLKVVVDGVNSIGGIAIPELLRALNVEVIELYCIPNGNFPHNPEPLKEHLGDLSTKVIETSSDFGIVVDPDVDRLAFIDEKGEMFGEEYTLVACADYVLSKKKGNTVSNMSSTRALRDVTEKHKGKYFTSAVGEVNVVQKMKTCNAVIGGEGNGGIIDPHLHYGRDSLIGTAFFLSLISECKLSVSELKKTYPEYFMSKGKIELEQSMRVDDLLEKIKEEYKAQKPNTVDGLKIDFKDSWVHLRKSNTEPIIRIYTEAPTQKLADELMNGFRDKLLSFNS